MHMSPGDGKHQLTDTLRRQRVRGDPSRRAVDRLAGFERVHQGGSSFRLHTDNFDTAGVPGGDAADETASADGDEEGIEIGRLLFKFESDSSLAEQRFNLIVSVDSERAGLP